MREHKVEVICELYSKLTTLVCYSIALDNGEVYVISNGCEDMILCEQCYRCKSAAGNALLKCL